MNRGISYWGIIFLFLASGCSADEPLVQRGDKDDDDKKGVLIEEDQRVETGDVEGAKPGDPEEKPAAGGEEDPPEDEPEAGGEEEEDNEYGLWSQESEDLFDLNVPIGKVGGQYLALSETVIKSWNGVTWSDYGVAAPFVVADFVVDNQGSIYATLLNDDNVTEIWYYTAAIGWKQTTLPQAGLENIYVKSPTEIYGVVANTIFVWQGIPNNQEEVPQGTWTLHSTLPGNYVTKIYGYQNYLYTAHGDQLYRFNDGINNWEPYTNPKEGLQPYVYYRNDKLYGIAGDGYQGYAVFTWDSNSEEWSQETPYKLGLKPVIYYAPNGSLIGAVGSALYTFEKN